MAFGAATIWDVRTTGADTNGGGFSTLVTNMATDLAATVANTAAPVVTSASYTFIARDVGHWLYIGAGTNWTPGWYQIASVAGGAATLTAGIGDGYLSSSNVPYAVTTAAGCATVASPTGGTWSIDYSQGTPIAFTDLVIDGTTNTDFTSAANPMGVNFIGNIFNVTSGTGFTVQRVQVVSVTGTAARADKSIGTLSSTGGNATAGGSLATPGLAGGLKVASNTVFLNAGSYTCSNSSNVAGGRVTESTSGTTTAPNYWVGWNTIRAVNNIAASLPLLKATANSVTIFTVSSNGNNITNLSFGKNASETNVIGLSMTGIYAIVTNCDATAILTGFSSTGGTVHTYLDCHADTCTTGFTCGIPANVVGCTSKDHIGSGFTSGSTNCVFVDCVSWGGSGVAGNGFATTNNGTTFINCTAYGNNLHGFTIAGTTTRHVLINCVSVGNSGNQFNLATATETSHRLIYCAAKADGTGSDNFNPMQKIGFILLTADPFTDSASDDFTLNSVAGGGALLKGAGFPQTFPGLAAANHPDIGAYQSESTGGGGDTGGGYMRLGL